MKSMDVDLTRVKPYGDTMNDGMVQLGFSLPVPCGEEAREAARRLAAKLGLEEPQVDHMADLGEGVTYFIVYGKCINTVAFTAIRLPKVDAPQMDASQLTRLHAS